VGVADQVALAECASGGDSADGGFGGLGGTYVFPTVLGFGLTPLVFCMHPRVDEVKKCSRITMTRR